MNILNVCPRYYPYIGGIDSHVKALSERTAIKENVAVASTDPQGKLSREEIINGVNVKRFKSWAPSESYHFSPKLKNYLSQNSKNFDVVHAYSYHDLPALYAAQSKTTNKFFFNPAYHGQGHTFFRNILIKAYHRIGKKIFDRADCIVCASNFERTLVERDFKEARGKTIVIFNGFCLEEFRNVTKKEHEGKSILCVARAEKYKGIQYLIQVLPKLHEGISLRIVANGPYKRTLVYLARNLGVEKRVTFLQNLTSDALLQEYANANLFALLSRYEAFGNSVGEALLSKTPCILANCSALIEWIDNVGCFGIDYPIDLADLGELVMKTIGKKVEYTSPRVSDWNDVVDKLLVLYNQY